MQLIKPDDRPSTASWLSARRLRARLCVLATLASLTTGASANDTTARLGIAALEFTKSDAITMVSEHLVISSTKITVRYVFLNTSAAPIRTQVAFPLPPDAYCAPDDPQRAGRNRAAEFLVKVDGRIVSTEWAHKAYLGDRDVTLQLKLIGLPDQVAFDRDRSRSYCSDEDEGLASINAVQRLALRAFGLLTKKSRNWRTSDIAHWQQVFPPGRAIRIEHEYVPTRGAVWEMRASEAQAEAPGRLMTSSQNDGGVDRACTDQGSERAVNQRVTELFRSSAARAVYVTLHDVEYILGTGRNWKGPVTEFTLDIVKQAPSDIVSLCFPGKPQKLDELSLRFRQKDFVPPDRLQVNFYSLSAQR